MLTLEQARSWYSVSDPVHGFDHVLRVYRMAVRLAQAEGADVEVVGAAALLHDATGSQEAGSAHDPQRFDHHLTSAGFARQVLLAEGWPVERISAVQHCIRAHRFRINTEQPQSLEARVLFDADKLDALGATGVVRVLAFAARAGQPAYAEPSDGFLRTGLKEPGEPHSSYHEFLFKLCKLKDLLYTPSARAIAEERHRFVEDFFTRLKTEIRGDL